MGRTLLIVQVVFGALIAGFALSRVLWLSNVLLFFTGACAADAVLDDLVAGAADRPRPPARPGHEHLHGGVPRRHAARQPGQRLRRQPHVGALVLAINGALVSLVAVYFLLRSHGVRRL